MRKFIRTAAVLLFVAVHGVAPGQQGGNPVIEASPLSHQYPPFDRIRHEHFVPALQQGMAEHLRELDAIANASAAPTFDNTIVAMERSGKLLRRASRWLVLLNDGHPNAQSQALVREMTPRLSEHYGNIQLDARLFARIDSLYVTRDTLGLDVEQRRLLSLYHDGFVRAGARLPVTDKAQLRAINSQIAQLRRAFAENTGRERTAAGVLFDTREQLAGLGDAEIASAAAAAKASGQDGKFLIRLLNTTGQPALAALERRDSREKVMAASLTRGSRGGADDNRELLVALVKKRAERAALLGHANHAASVMADRSAGSVDAVVNLLSRMTPAATRSARAEQAALQAAADSSNPGITIGPADWAYYAEKVRAARFGFDSSQLRPYYEMDNVLVKGVLFAATRLYGISFKERTDLPVYEPTVRVFEVFDTNGAALGIVIFDPYTRPNKIGGAWAKLYASYDALSGEKPVIVVMQNIPAPASGQPTLLTHTEVVQQFHEFGHVWHFLFSRVRYPRLAGVPTDYIEFPAQANEMWAAWPEVLHNYARHHITGQPMPAEMLAARQRAGTFGMGFSTTENLASTLIDLEWHQLASAAVPEAASVLAFESLALKKHGLDMDAVPPRYRSTYFSHVFPEGYSAGYYSYLWSEILSAQTTEWMKRNGGLRRENGDHFRETLLSRGGSDDGKQLFRDFTGESPDSKWLMLRRGLLVD